MQSLDVRKSARKREGADQRKRKREGNRNSLRRIKRKWRERRNGQMRFWTFAKVSFLISISRTSRPTNLPLCRKKKDSMCRQMEFLCKYNHLIYQPTGNLLCEHQSTESINRRPFKYSFVSKKLYSPLNFPSFILKTTFLIFLEHLHKKLFVIS